MISANRSFIVLTLIGLTIASLGLTVLAQFQSNKTPVFKVRVVASFPHDPKAFTQGLVIEKGWLYEGTGQHGASSLRKVELKTGQVQKQTMLDQQYFGEGITILNNKIYQLTWQNRIGFVYDLETMKYQSSFRYSREGWGLTHDGKHLISSDGGSELSFLDPETFKEIRKIVVREGKKRIKELNELEYVDGKIWANVWYEDRIVMISPSDGQVVGWVDLSDVYPAKLRDREAVLNGIAYDQESKQLFVTGKNWPTLFQIEVVP